MPLETRRQHNNHGHSKSSGTSIGFGEGFDRKQGFLDFEKGQPENGTPASFRLAQNHPNPFNPSTRIQYDLPAKCQVSLRIFNLSGKLIRPLRDEVTEEAGSRDVVWDGTNSHGSGVSAGVYLYRLQAGRFVETKRMALVR